MPLSHPPGHAQCDFGEALVIIGGVEQKAHCFVLNLPHSDGCFVKAYPAETTEAFLDGHVSGFAFLGGVPQSILYDNTKLAVATSPTLRRLKVFGRAVDLSRAEVAGLMLLVGLARDFPQLCRQYWEAVVQLALATE